MYYVIEDKEYFWSNFHLQLKNNILFLLHLELVLLHKNKLLNEYLYSSCD